MHDVLEGHGEHGGYGAGPDMMPATITLSILAVLVAITTLMGHRASKEELLLQNQESDQWNYYQAKNQRMMARRIGADELGLLMPVDKEKAEAVRQKYEEEAARYDKEKEEASNKAMALQKERLLVETRGDRYEAGEVILEIALIICSFTLLTKKKAFWYAGMVLGAVGISSALSGLLLH